MAIDQNSFDRASIELINSKKVRSIFDFAYGDYKAHDDFFDELSRIQSSLVNDGKVKLSDGTIADLETAGGALALQIFMETIETRKETMSGLAKLGLKNENKLWTMLN